MQTKSFDAREHISELNRLRLELGSKLIYKSDFKDLLEECGIPRNPLFWKEFINSDIVNRVGNLYCFSSPNKPIHHLDLQNIYDKYYTTRCKYYKTYKEKKGLKLIQNNKEIANAINLLKSYGFEIFAPMGTLYSKL